MLDLGFDAITWYLMISTAVLMFGMVRLLLVRDLMARLVALDVTGLGVLLMLVALAARSSDETGAQTAETGGAGPDAVLQALVITGLVIAVAFTGLGAVLIRRIEGAQDTERSGTEPSDTDAPGPGVSSTGRDHDGAGSEAGTGGSGESHSGEFPTPAGEGGRDD